MTRPALGFRWDHTAGIALLAAGVAFSGTSGDEPVRHLLIVAAAVATAASIWAAARFGEPTADVRVLTAWALVAVATGLIEVAARWAIGRSLGIPELLALVPVALVVLAVSAVATGRSGPLELAWPWVLGACVLLIGAAYLAVEPEPQIDVLLANRAGAEALARGENPYVTVVVPDSNPYVEDGATFDGYVYPPLALVLYAVSDWVFGDPRWINVLAVACFVVALASSARRARTGLLGAAVLVLFVVKPAFGLILYNSWTEPISLPFLLGSALLWRKRPLPAAILLGLGFATKQYFILALPLLLLWRDEQRWRRVAIVTGVVAATMAPFVILDPVAYWNATVAPSLAAAARPDSVGLAGWGLALPTVLTLGLPITVAAVLARRGGGGAAFIMALAGTLATSFFLGFQAFANYWFLIYALVATAILLALTESLAGTESVGAAGT